MQLSLRQKLFLLVLLPVITLLFLQGTFLIQKWQELKIYQSQRWNIELMEKTASTITQLQKERGRSSIYIGSGRGRAELEEQRKKVDAALEVFQGYVNKASYVKKEALQTLQNISSLRNKADTRSYSTPKQVIDEYTQPIQALLNISNLAVNQKTIGGIGKVMSSVGVLQEAQEGGARYPGAYEWDTFFRTGYCRRIHII